MLHGPEPPEKRCSYNTGTDVVRSCACFCNAAHALLAEDRSMAGSKTFAAIRELKHRQAIPGTLTAPVVGASICRARGDRMAKKQKRDNSYYKGRLQREHPGIYRDLVAGKYGSDREAFIAAGIKKPRTPLHELKNAWGKATAAEQRNFLRWLSARPGATTTPASIASPPPTTPVAINRRLEGWAKARIQVIMDRRTMSSGDVMNELGFKRLNPSLGLALARGDRLQPEMINAIEEWLDTNKAV